MKRVWVFAILLLFSSPLKAINSDNEIDLSLSEVKALFESKIIWTQNGKNCPEVPIEELMQLSFFEEEDKISFEEFFDNPGENEAALLLFARAIWQEKTFSPNKETLAYAIDWPDSVRAVAQQYMDVSFWESAIEECAII